MSGFIFFLVLVFVVFPNLSKIGKAKRAAQKPKFKSIQKTWGQTHTQIAKTKTDQYGHSDTRDVRHQQMHSKDGNQVFPEEHRNHVREREARDKQAKRKIEQGMHSRDNISILRAGSKGRSDWGVRGDSNKGFIGVLIGLAVLGALAYYGMELTRNN
jgi:hypothetical protein